VPWLVTPVEGVVALAAMAAAARRLLGPREALLAVGLLGAAPLFAFQAASFFSHTATTMWLGLAFVGVLAWSREGRSWQMVLAGAAIGCAFVTRPLDAVLFGAALLSMRSVRAVVLAAAGAAPFVALLLAYQAAQFGSPFSDGYAAYEPTFRAIYGAHTGGSALSIANLVDGEQAWHHLDIVRAFLIDWTVPGAALLALLGWTALRDDAGLQRARRFSGTLIVLFGLTLFVTIGGTDDGARPRYLSTALIPLAWLGARGWGVARDLLGERIGRTARRTIGVLVWVLPVIQLGAFLVARTPDLWVREGLQKTVEKQGIDGVVVVRAEYPTRYARNGPFFSGRVLYVSAPWTMGPDEVAAAFPGRPVYEAREGKVWSVTQAETTRPPPR
jgi:4-amino-4-deoxy-L-arabinose transferase-like glycosyltransferase